MIERRWLVALQLASVGTGAVAWLAFRLVAISSALFAMALVFMLARWCLEWLEGAE